MTSFDAELGIGTLRSWLRRQQAAMQAEARAVENPEPSDAVASLLVGAAFVFGGYQLAMISTSGVVWVLGYELVGRATATLIGVAMVRFGVPEALSGLRTAKVVRSDTARDDAPASSERSEPEVAS